MENFAQLVTESRNPRSADIDRVPTAEMLAIINREDANVASAVAQAIPRLAELVDRAAERLRNGGHLYYIGAGTSGRLGVLDASECPPTFGVPADLVQGIIAGGEAALSRATEASEDDPESGARDLAAREAGAKDVVVGIAASGRTPYVAGAIAWARKQGALTAAVVCAPESLLAAAVEIAIEAPVGPEVITGSTRMKAGTATKLILNMLTTGLMVRLGYTYGNLMVNVQPKNRKLEDRAQRIIADACGVAPEIARQAFLDSGRNVRTAIVMLVRGVDRKTAEARIAERGPVLAEVLHG